MSLGYAFSPTTEQAAQAKHGQASPPFGSQGAIQTLNYSLPKVTGVAGASALSPMLGDTQLGSGITSAVLQSVLRTVLGPDHASLITQGRADNGPQDFSAILGQLGGGGDSAAQAGPSPSVRIHPAGELAQDAPAGTPDTLAFPSGSPSFGPGPSPSLTVNATPTVDTAAPSFGGSLDSYSASMRREREL